MRAPSICTVIVACFLFVGVSAQDAAGPTKTPVPPTPAQLDKLKAAVKLHDQGKFDDAIAIYEDVLKENPDCVPAIYEWANSVNAKKDYPKVIEIATRGTTYNSPQLSAFYLEIGSAYDDMGAAKKAVETYKQGIAISPTFLLHFNLGLTYERLKNDDDAKGSLKQAAFLNANHASTQAELGKVFLRGGYTMPALFALSRFLVIEPGSARTGEVFRLWYQMLEGGVTVNGNSITVSAPTPKTDEGDFSGLEMLIEIGKATAPMMPASSAESADSAKLVRHVGVLLDALGKSDVQDRSSFAWSYYAPYFVELQKRGYVEPFVYWVAQRTNLPGVREWVADPANRQRANEFAQWSQKYVWPSK